LGSFAFDSTRWVIFLGLLSSFKMSLFFNVKVVDVNNDDCDTTDSNDGVDDDEKSINNQADAVNSVDGDDSNTGGIKTLDEVVFFFSTFESNLPFFFCRSIISLVLAMVSPKNECLGATVCLQQWR
jgi:hypothetical protein